MKILLSPDSYKGSLSAVKAVEAMSRGICRVSPDISVIGVPLSDGGEGFIDALVVASGGKLRRKCVTGPLGKPVNAHYGIIDGGKTGVIEMAAAAGLPLLSVGERNPLLTTTYGVGELIRSALSDGCSTIIIGAGGSATVDGGIGLLQALGVEFLDTGRKPVGRGGGELPRIRSMNIDALRRFAHVTFVVAADVTNPLCGKRGAARVYAPQKGADAATIRFLDRGLKHFADCIERQIGKKVANIPGAGAAGGMAAGVCAFLNARIASGVGIVLEKSGLEKKLAGCSLVITGEGRTDAQTMNGKAPLGVALRARKQGIPVVCLSGSLGGGVDKLYSGGFDAFFSLCDGPMDESEAVADAAGLLARATENIVRLYRGVYRHPRRKSRR